MWLLVYLLLAVLIVVKLIAHLTRRDCKSNVCLVGKTAIITGADRGMGYLTALNLASRGCRVIIADVVDGTKSVQKIIKETGNQDVVYMLLDLASFESVRKFVTQIINQEKRLDILINNAGVGGFHSNTEDGIFKVLQINYLGHFLLTHLLFPLLKQTKDSRVVFVSSLLAFTHDFSNGLTINRPTTIQFAPMKPIYDYGNSKIAILVATKIFARKFEKYGINVYATHPGLVATSIFATSWTHMSADDMFVKLSKLFINISLFMFAKTPYQGIQCTLHAALAKNIQSGSFLVECTNFFLPPIAKDETFCNDLWASSVKLSKLTEQEEIK